jgi:two-component system, sensor histidine kinase LadS
MKKYALLFYILFAFFPIYSQIVFEFEEDDNVGFFSLAEHSFILEDVSHELTFEQISLNEYEWQQLNEPIPNLDFTASSYWVRVDFSLNFTDKETYLLEIARPLTNVVTIYLVNQKKEVTILKGGDEITFENRPFQHRKMLFPLTLQPNEQYRMYVQLRSDGEVITLPMYLWKQDSFIQADNKEQSILGFYYGILAFVFVMYFFFYLALREKSFLYYILYVLALILFQLSLDGLAFQYLWPNNVWLGNHAIIIFAGFTILFINMYAKDFLNTHQILPTYDKIFKGFIILACITILWGFTGGVVYQFSFPVANAIGFFSTVFIFITIVAAIRKNCKVSIFFALAFIFLIIGSIVFVLANFNVLPHNLLTEHAIKYGSALEVTFLSLSMAAKFREIQLEKETAQQSMLENLAELNQIKEQANIKLEQQVKERTLEIEKQKEEIEEKNHDIMSSIHYAKRIQTAILPADELMNDCLPDAFVLYEPKDVVSGDFYWVAQTSTSDTNKKIVLFAAADCTGHGVPGAFMSLIGNNYLQASLKQSEVNTPAQALDFLNKGVQNTLEQNKSETLKDGMDIALCAWLKEDKKLYFAGAKNPLYMIKNNELIEIKGDKQPIGAYLDEERIPFTNHEITLDGGEMIYVFTDGFADQFGGPKGKKFRYGQFKDLLMEIHQLPLTEQKNRLREAFFSWKGNLEQIDDVCIIGVRL